MRACTGKDWQRSKDGCNSLLGARVERLVPSGTLRLSSVVCQWRLHVFGTCYNTLPFSPLRRSCVRSVFAPTSS